jgi:chemotaxis methyl-accepting protein methylase
MSVATPPVNTGTFDFLCNFVRDKSAIVLEPSKAYLVESRLNPVARENGLSSLDELVAALKPRFGDEGHRCDDDERVELFSRSTTV